MNTSSDSVAFRHLSTESKVSTLALMCYNLSALFTIGGLVAVFRDRSLALDAYAIHPEQILVAEFGRTISEHVVSVDFLSE